MSSHYQSAGSLRLDKGPHIAAGMPTYLQREEQWYDEDQRLTQLGKAVDEVMLLDGGGEEFKHGWNTAIRWIRRQGASNLAAEAEANSSTERPTL